MTEYYVVRAPDGDILRRGSGPIGYAETIPLEPGETIELVDGLASPEIIMIDGVPQYVWPTA